MHSAQRFASALASVAILALGCTSGTPLHAADAPTTSALSPASATIEAALLHPRPGHPLTGIYTTTGTKGTQAADAFAAWVGTPVLLGHDSMPTVATWDQINGRDLGVDPNWLFQPWLRWKKAAPGRRTSSCEAVSRKTTSFKAASLKTATVAASVVWTPPAVVPGACADKDAACKPAWTVVAIGRASIRIVRVIAVSADRRAIHIAANADPDSDARSNNDRCLRVRQRQRK